MTGNKFTKLTTATKQYISTKELAEYFGVSIHTVRAWIWQKRVEAFKKKVGRLVRFDLQKIEEYLNENGVFPPEMP